ncbi:hypothetical protein DSAG12_02767 [Promethearchaeum syntrophicum]|uniref:Uncharacterized protein n=1 Tax=Promethearchaeum syntrophicum TaxID=2594042 RepID=A0A5B9DDY1_9ARCH|nr:hypothetical protein [Candidatus Prometheoarchaeum syntrophicum]
MLKELDNSQDLIREKILQKLNDFNHSNIKFENLLLIISEIDIRSLIFACFIESPIIFIENDFEHQRLIILITVLRNIFPNMLETCLFFSPEEYLKYSKDYPSEIRKFTIYNLVYKLSVNKPFLDSQSEPFQKNIRELCYTNAELNLNQCRIKFEKLTKFSDKILDYPETKSEKLAEIMKKKYPENKVVFTGENISLMRERLKFNHFYSYPDLRSSVGPIYIWNDSIEKSDINAISNVIEKLCLNVIYEHHKISTIDLLGHLQKFAIAKMAKLNQNSLIELLQKYIEKAWLIKK